MTTKPGWADFLKLCHEAKNLEQLDELMGLLLTAEERAQLALRVDLIRELMQGQKSQRDIAKELEISIAKITRGSNALKIINEDLHRYLEKELL